MAVGDVGDLVGVGETETSRRLHHDAVEDVQTDWANSAVSRAFTRRSDAVQRP
jgi:hypothetical protein